MRARVENVKLQARAAGFLYLVVFVAIFALFTRDALIVSGDAAATAHNILAAEAQFRVALLADLASAAAYIGVTGLLYLLLKPVNRAVSLLAALFGLAGSCSMAINLVHHFAPLVLLGEAGHFGGFSSEQLHGLARIALSLQGAGYNIAGFLFALHLLLLGWLVLGATFLPRILGMLLVIGALAYMTNIAAVFLAPNLSAALHPYILLPGFFGEAGLALWLVSMGVNETKWRAQADGLT